MSDHSPARKPTMKNCLCGLDGKKAVFWLGATVVPAKGYCHVECPKCGYRTGSHATVAQAIAEWDSRQSVSKQRRVAMFAKQKTNKGTKQ